MTKTTNLWFNYNKEDDCFYILMHSPNSERMPEDIVVSATSGETLWMSCQYADFQPFARIIFETVQRLQKVANKSILVVVENETTDA